MQVGVFVLFRWAPTTLFRAITISSRLQQPILPRRQLGGRARRGGSGLARRLGRRLAGPAARLLRAGPGTGLLRAGPGTSLLGAGPGNGLLGAGLLDAGPGPS